MAYPSALQADETPYGSGRTGAVIQPARLMASAVSWGAVSAGAAAAAALSLILLILGVGLGLSSVSPWAMDGVSAATFGLSTILWLTLTQLVASAIGGYLTGRLRTRWTDAPADEVFFRDTAHGFLAWAVASLATAALLTSVIGSVVNGGAQAGATVVGGAATGAAALAAKALPAMGQGSDSGALGYAVDSLFRTETGPAAGAAGAAGTGAAATAAAADTASAATAAGTSAPAAVDGAAANGRASGQDMAEITRIFVNADAAQTLAADDLRRVGQIVAQHTGLPQAQAQQRVSEVFARAQTRLRETEVAARAAVDKARKASAYGALWLFVSLLIGAFVASLSATVGGRQRDA